MPQDQEIHDLLIRYTRAYDSRNLAELEQCFTQDAIMRVEQPDGTVEDEKVGRDEVMAMFRGLLAALPEQRRHVATNILVANVSDGMATVDSYLLLFKQEGGQTRLVSTGTYKDVVVNHDGWRIQRRVVRMDSSFPIPGANATG